MFSQNQLPWPASAPREEMLEGYLPYDTADLEIWPDKTDAGEVRFREAVRQAATAAGGELLFDLPAEGLIADRLRIAVARIPDDDEKMRLVLATLDEDGEEIHLQMPDATTAHLVGFANAFVGLFHRIAEPEAAAELQHADAEAMPAEPRDDGADPAATMLQMREAWAEAEAAMMEPEAAAA